MDADRPLKTLFKLRAADLLPMTGDRGARVLSRIVPELTAVTRRLDFVLELRRGAAMRLGLGGAALVGVTGRRSLRLLEAAARRIKRQATPRQCRDLSAVLRMLSEGRYTARELERVVPKEVVMGSSLLAEVRRRSRAEGRAEGREEGREEGKVAGIRAVCEDLVRQHHPGVLSDVAPEIRARTDPNVLRDWILAAPLVSDTELVRLIKSAPSGAQHGPAPGSSRVRAPRPSRRTRPRR